MKLRAITSERLTNLGLGLLRGVTDLATRGALAVVYDAVPSHALLGGRSLASVLGAFVLYDLLYYVAHRAQHRVGGLWAMHAVHHEAKRFDVTVGLRVHALNGVVLFPFFLPLAALGVPFSTYLTLSVVHAALMTWLHTERVAPLGVVERWLNTPALHRVHHSSLPEHADRNFGGVFSFWDRAFGTFAEPAAVVSYGVY